MRVLAILFVFVTLLALAAASPSDDFTVQGGKKQQMPPAAPPAKEQEIVRLPTKVEEQPNEMKTLPAIQGEAQQVKQLPSVDEGRQPLQVQQCTVLT